MFFFMLQSFWKLLTKRQNRKLNKGNLDESSKHNEGLGYIVHSIPFPETKKFFSRYHNRSGYCSDCDITQKQCLWHSLLHETVLKSVLDFHEISKSINFVNHFWNWLVSAVKKSTLPHSSFSLPFPQFPFFQKSVRKYEQCCLCWNVSSARWLFWNQH